MKIFSASSACGGKLRSKRRGIDAAIQRGGITNREKRITQTIPQFELCTLLIQRSSRVSNLCKTKSARRDCEPLIYKKRCAGARCKNDDNSGGRALFNCALAIYASRRVYIHVHGHTGQSSAAAVADTAPQARIRLHSRDELHPGPRLGHITILPRSQPTLEHFRSARCTVSPYRSSSSRLISSSSSRIYIHVIYAQRCRSDSPAPQRIYHQRGESSRISETLYTPSYPFSFVIVLHLYVLV